MSPKSKRVLQVAVPVVFTTVLAGACIAVLLSVPWPTDVPLAKCELADGTSVSVRTFGGGTFFERAGQHEYALADAKGNTRITIPARTIPEDAQALCSVVAEREVVFRTVVGDSGAYRAEYTYVTVPELAVTSTVVATARRGEALDTVTLESGAASYVIALNRAGSESELAIVRPEGQPAQCSTMSACKTQGRMHARSVVAGAGAELRVEYVDARTARVRVVTPRGDELYESMLSM